MILLLLACASDPLLGLPDVAITLPGGAVIDPKLDGATLPIAVGVVPFATGACTATVTATNPAGQEWVAEVPLTAQTGALAGEVAWDGRDAGGIPFDVGAIALVATARCGEARASTEGDAWVIRLGVAAVDFDEGSDPLGHVPLAFHKIDVRTPGVQIIDDLTPEYAVAAGPSDLDLEDGAPRASIPPWSDADAPPWGADEPSTVDVNVPAAAVAGGTVHLRITPGTVAINPRTRTPATAIPEGVPRLRLRLGDSVTDWTSAIALSLRLPDDGLGEFEIPLTWSWEVEAGDDWVPLAGSITTTHRLYRTAGPSALRDGADIGAAPPVPWVATLDELAPVVQGLPADPAAVLDAVRDHLHENPWVIYDPSDTDYSGYHGAYIYWDYTWSELTEWLDRDSGVRLYCHSMSCLLSVLAGSQGVSAPQQVLGVGFYTNLTRAAGTEDWQHWSFNSHSVVSPDDGATIWDASIDLDGDEDPYSMPVEPVAPKGMPGDEYLWRLTYDDVAIVNSGLCYVY